VIAKGVAVCAPHAGRQPVRQFWTGGLVSKHQVSSEVSTGNQVFERVLIEIDCTHYVSASVVAEILYGKGRGQSAPLFGRRARAATAQGLQPECRRVHAHDDQHGQAADAGPHGACVVRRIRPRMVEACDWGLLNFQETSQSPRSPSLPLDRVSIFGQRPGTAIDRCSSGTAGSTGSVLSRLPPSLSF